MNSDLMTVSLVSQAKNVFYFSSLPEGKQTTSATTEEQASANLNSHKAELSINNQSFLKDALLVSHFNMESISPFEQHLTDLASSITILIIQLKMEKHELKLWALFPFHTHWDDYKKFTA